MERFPSPFTTSSSFLAAWPPSSEWWPRFSPLTAWRHHFWPDKDQNDQIVWFKATGRMCGALATLFLIAVYLLGHSMTSLFLLFLWGLLNFLNFALMIPADLKDGGSEEAQRCNSYMKQQVGAFALLEAIAVLLAYLDHRCKSKPNSLEEHLSSSE